MDKYFFSVNEKHYHRLVADCDKVLIAGKSNIFRLSIAWLHVLRPHPCFLNHYQQVWKAENKIAFKVYKKATESITLFFILSRQLFWSLIFHFNAKATLRTVIHKSDLVLVSHANDVEQALQDGCDAFFGQLPSELSRRGVKVVVLYICGRNAAQSRHEYRVGNDSVVRVTLPKAISIPEEVGIIFGLIRERCSLPKSVETYGLSKRFLSTLKDNVFSHRSLHTLRLATQIAGLVSCASARFLLTTFEGHAWESCTYALVRKSSPSTKCFAYHHSILFYLQHALVREISAISTPDMIFTAGKHSQNVLLRKRVGQQQNVVLLGSPRYSTRLERGFKNRTTGSHVALVLPEAIDEEVRTLFAFAKRSAQLFPEVKFIFRYHPLNSSKSLQKKLMASGTPENFKFSANTLQEDCVSCDFALYRGSTAIIEAVKLGLYPIYVSNAEKITIDPFYMAEKKRGYIEKPEDLMFVVEKSKLTSNADRAPLMSCCESHLSPYDIEKFQVLMV